eukprot:gene17276-23591_t
MVDSGTPFPMDVERSSSSPLFIYDNGQPVPPMTIKVRIHKYFARPGMATRSSSFSDWSEDLDFFNGGGHMFRYINGGFPRDGGGDSSTSSDNSSSSSFVECCDLDSGEAITAIVLELRRRWEGGNRCDMSSCAEPEGWVFSWKFDSRPLLPLNYLIENSQGRGGINYAMLSSYLCPPEGRNFEDALVCFAKRTAIAMSALQIEPSSSDEECINCNSGSDEECIICKSAFCDLLGPPYKIKACQHDGFCRPCLEKWFISGSLSCPLCRASDGI